MLTQCLDHIGIFVFDYFFPVVPKLLFVGMKVPNVLKNSKTNLKLEYTHQLEKPSTIFSFISNILLQSLHLMLWNI